MYTVSFYSVKGGVGRTLAAANVALVLAARGKKVIVVDFDLEAPGLTFMPEFDAGPNKPGLCELIAEYRKRFDQQLATLAEADPGQPPSEARFREMAADILPRIQRFVHKPKGIRAKGKPHIPAKVRKNLRFVPAGLVNEDYFARVAALDFDDLYERQQGDTFFQLLKTELARLRFKPDYLILDARTGISDTSWPVAVQLPEAVVVITGLNEPNREGTRLLLKTLRSREKPADLVVVISLVPHHLHEQVYARERELAQLLQISHEPLGIRFPYEAALALSCRTVVTDPVWEETELVRQYQALADRLVLLNTSDPEGHLVKAAARLEEQKLHEALDEFRLSLLADPFNRNTLAMTALLEFMVGSAEAGLQDLYRLATVKGWQDADLSRLFDRAFDAVAEGPDDVAFARVLEIFQGYRGLTSELSRPAEAQLIANVAGYAARMRLRNLQGVLELVAVLETYCAEAPEDPDMRGCLADALNNLLSLHAALGKLEDARDYLARVQRLYEVAPENARICGALAAALRNFCDGHAQRGDFENAISILDQLFEFYNAHQDVPDVGARLGAALYDLSNHLADNDKLAEAMEVLNRLQQLHQAHPQAPEVGRRLAMTLFNRCNDCREAEQAGTAARLLDDLRRLHHAHRDDADIRERLAAGLFNMGFAAKETDRTDDAQELLHELTVLLDEHPQDDEVAARAASGLAELASLSDAVPDVAARDRYLELLAKCLAGHRIRLEDLQRVIRVLGGWQTRMPESSAPLLWLVDNLGLFEGVPDRELTNHLGSFAGLRIAVLQANEDWEATGELLDLVGPLCDSHGGRFHDAVLMTILANVEPLSDGLLDLIAGRLLSRDEILRELPGLDLIEERKARLRQRLRAT